MNEEERIRLAVLARKRIRDGALPCGAERQLTTLDGHTPCSLCGLPVRGGETVYTIKDHKPPLHFHLECDSIWRAECDRLSTSRTV